MLDGTHNTDRGANFPARPLRPACRATSSNLATRGRRSISIRPRSVSRPGIQENDRPRPSKFSAFEASHGLFRSGQIESRVKFTGRWEGGPQPPLHPANHAQKPSGRIHEEFGGPAWIEKPYAMTRPGGPSLRDGWATLSDLGNTTTSTTRSASTRSSPSAGASGRRTRRIGSCSTSSPRRRRLARA